MLIEVMSIAYHNNPTMNNLRLFADGRRVSTHEGSYGHKRSKDTGASLK